MSDVAYVSIPEEEELFLDWFSDNKKLNFNLAVLFLAFSMMLFHFAAVYFFTIQLESIALVWIFLWLWNFFAFLFDVPIWILQYHFKYKTLLIASVISQIVAMAIFANFIFWATDFLSESLIGEWNNNWIITGVLSFFLTSWLNLFLLLFASICYWFARESQDITLLSYVLRNANPSQYKIIVAQKNLFFGIGLFMWLILSWIILSFAPKVIIFNIIIAIWIATFISFRFFDKDEKVIKFNDIDKFKVYFDKNNSIWKIKEDVSTVINKVDLLKMLSSTKLLFLRPIVISDKKINLNYMLLQTKQNFIDIFYTLIYAQKFNLILLWAFSMVLTFWFWDTFASTFLIDFLNQLKNWWSYILLWLLAIPAFWLQEYFGKLSDKLGTYFLVNIGLAISWFSLFFMAFIPIEWNFIIIMTLALANSVWYAICMWLSQALFLESYNKVYAEKNKLDQIDSNASAAPMKILQNFGNVIWLLLGSIILWIFDYTWFFIVFGWFILGFLVWSLIKKESLN